MGVLLVCVVGVLDVVLSVRFVMREVVSVNNNNNIYLKSNIQCI